MALAKERKMNPRQLASDVVAKLNVSDLCDNVEPAGAGFLNFRLKPSVIVATLKSASLGEHLFFTSANPRRTIVVDFSSPNVAKPMHVGHIRSTILGDTIARTLRLLGHHVITDNHIGDWGTQFGMLIAAWKIFKLRKVLRRKLVSRTERNQSSWTLDVLRIITSFGERRFSTQDLYYYEPRLRNKHPTTLHVRIKIQQQLQLLRDLGLLRSVAPGFWKRIPRDSLSELEAFYKLFQKQSEEDPRLLPAARAELRKLQDGDPQNLSIWKEMILLSQSEFDQIYMRLGVKFDYTYGESFYNPMLKEVVTRTMQKRPCSRKRRRYLRLFRRILTAKTRSFS